MIFKMPKIVKYIPTTPDCKEKILRKQFIMDVTRAQTPGLQIGPDPVPGSGISVQERCGGRGMPMHKVYGLMRKNSSCIFCAHPRLSSINGG